MTDIREVLDEIEKGLPGVTPGPWFTTGAPWFRSGDGVLCGSPDGNIAFLIADTDDFATPREEYEGPFKLGDKEADAAHIARLDPQTMLAIIELARKGLAADAGEGWQPIDDAPHDIDLLLGWWRKWPSLKWETEVGFAHSTKGGWWHGQATHWRPLPASPTQEPS